MSSGVSWLRDAGAGTPLSLFPGFLSRLFKHAGDTHRLTAQALAFVGGFHKGEDLNGLLWTDRGDAGAEELDDLHHQSTVAFIRTDGGNALRAEGGTAVAAFP